MADLGRLKRLEPREAWKSESDDFTPWLAQEENLRLLGDTLEMQLELVKKEKEVGPYRADILCKDLSDDSWVLIENQLENTDHTHLGQILTYAAGLEAVTVIWIAKSFSDEHRAALDWLNEHTVEKIAFFGLEVELWCIGDSPIAPKFNIVAKPNDWTHAGGSARMSEQKQLQLEFWKEFSAFAEQDGAKLRCPTPHAQTWMNFSLGRTGFFVAAVITDWDTELLKYNHHARVELAIAGPHASEHFKLLQKQKAEIERDIGDELGWRIPKESQKHRIYLKLPSNYFNRDEWPAMHKWLKDKLELFHKVFTPRVKALATLRNA